MAEDQGQAGEGSEASGLRKQLEDALAENKTLKETAREGAFKSAGFPIDVGNGKALANLYKGDPDPAAIKQFAKDEFGWEPAQSAAGDQQAGLTDVELARISAGQRADQLAASSVSVEPLNVDAAIRTAEQNQDWDTVDRLNQRKLAAVRAQ